MLIGVSDEDLQPISHLADAESLELVQVGGYEEATDPLCCDPDRFVAEAVGAARAAAAPFDGIIQLDDYPSSMLVPIIAEQLGLKATSVLSVFRCEHKYWSRVVQREAVPEAVPSFELVSLAGRVSRPRIPYPFWLKPVKSYMSYLGFRIGNEAEFIRAVERCRTELPPFVAAFNRMLRPDAAPPGLAHIDGHYLIAEELMVGRQCCLEGYVQGGEVTVLGIVDSLRLPNRVSFTRFRYPSRIPAVVQRQMADIARRVVAAFGLDHTLFNIEMFWDPRRPAPMIVEINSRLSAQFADLFQKVDGTGTYEVLLDLALGRKPRWTRRQGRHRVAASFVLRTRQDRLVTRIPSEQEIARAAELVPDLVFKSRALPGRRLSEWPQDTFTYRYGLIHVGGRDEAELKARFALARSLLPFAFADAQESEEETPSPSLRRIAATGD
jgi:hypothetical protein